MQNSPWEGFGKVFGDIIQYIYIYIGIFLLAVVITAIAVAAYLKKRKQQDDNNRDSKQFVLARIVLYICLGLLILIAAPILLGAIL